jgi:hypothetical protein
MATGTGSHTLDIPCLGGRTSGGAGMRSEASSSVQNDGAAQLQTANLHELHSVEQIPVGGLS